MKKRKHCMRYKRRGFASRGISPRPSHKLWRALAPPSITCSCGVVLLARKGQPCDSKKDECVSGIGHRVPTAPVRLCEEALPAQHATAPLRHEQD
eukprot:1513976-Amphidinium_carterae.1